MIKSKVARSTKAASTFLVLTFCISVAIVSCKVATAQADATISTVEAEFHNPDRQYRAHMRFWIPEAAIDESVLRSQVADIAKAGLGDLELVAFDFARAFSGAPGSTPDASAPKGPTIDHAVYGWGTPNWTNTMKIVLDEAGKRGIKATFIMGPQWPISSPLLTRSSPGVEVQLACSRVDLQGKEYNGDVTGDIAREGVSSELVGIVAGKRLGSAANSPIEIKSLVDITANAVKNPSVTDRQAYTLHWTPSDGSGDWSLFFYWKGPVGEKVAGFYVVDHFSKEGAKSVTDYYKGVFDQFAKENLLRYCNGLFGDSLEYRSSVDWTGALLAAFKRIKGYDLTPYLPAINNGVRVPGDPRFGGDKVGQEAFDGAGANIRNDYYDVLTHLFIENHLKPIQAFLEGYGENLRYQTAYGKRMEQATTSMNVGIPEGEMMMIRNEFDNIRAQAGAVHLMGKIEYNVELQAEMRKNHAQSWDNLLYFVQRAFSAGVTNLTFHGYNYTGQFSGTGNVEGHLPSVTWPGWEAFGRDGFSNSWGSEPLWLHARENTDFMARNSFVLKQGTAKIDLAVFRESFWDNAAFTAQDGDTWYRDGGLLQDRGYSYDLVSLRNLELPQAKVTGGRLDEDGPAYKALILDQSLDTSDAAMPAENKSIGLESAKKILELARAGLPVVYIGEAPAKATFYHPADQVAADKQVQSLMSDLKGLKNVRQAPTINDVPAVLDSLKITSDAQILYTSDAGQSKLINIHRAATSIDYYYIYNRGLNSNSGFKYGWKYGAAREMDLPDASANITFRAKGTPYRLDTWTGAITPIANYTSNDSGMTIPLGLKFNESTVIAFDHGSVLKSGEAGKVHVTSMNSGQAYYDGNGNLAIKAPSNGAYHVTLSDGSAKDVKVDAVPSPINLSGWKLKVEDWNPGATVTSTAQSIINVDLGDLRPWRSVQELENSSGIGTYTATFQMDKGWEQGVGAYVNLGTVNFGYKLKINGTEVKANQIDTVIDIGPYVKAGDNTIEVEVATTLNNKLKKVYDVSSRTLDYYGLIGSGSVSTNDGIGGVVTVTPYRIAAIR
jgi:alpha-L-rhamnosidase/Glycosyl hydrolases family 2, sugar binding domain